MSAIDIKTDSIRFNMRAIAMSRMLSQFYGKKILQLLVQAYIDEVQELSTAIADLIEKRTLNKAEGNALDTIGKIVGRSREYYNYEASYWFAPDTEGVSPDSGHWWCYPAEHAVGQAMDDVTYRKWLWMQILENHNLYSSTPEIENNILDGIGETVGIQRTGMMEADLYVSQNISLTNKNLLTYNTNNTLTENDYLFPYPATTNIDQVEEV
jgi:hypothetical protein